MEYLFLFASAAVGGAIGGWIAFRIGYHQGIEDGVHASVPQAFDEGVRHGKTMTITHDKIDLRTPDEPVMFARLLGVSCSICAPDHMNAAQVAAYANKIGPRPAHGEWRIVDKGLLGLGASTPNPCNQVAGRQHWFLLGDGTEP